MQSMSFRASEPLVEKEPKRALARSAVWRGG